MPQFTSDWFSNALVNFDYITNYLQKQKTVDSILEIGSHEGRSTCWMLENMLAETGTITCIDPFADRPVTAFSSDLIPRIVQSNKSFAPTQQKFESLVKH
jgi:hypothetical protein